MLYRFLISIIVALPLIVCGAWRCVGWLKALVNRTNTPDEFEFYLFLFVWVYPLLIGSMLVSNFLSYRRELLHDPTALGKAARSWNVRFVPLAINALFIYYWIFRVLFKI